MFYNVYYKDVEGFEHVEMNVYADDVDDAVEKFRLDFPYEEVLEVVVN